MDHSQIMLSVTQGVTCGALTLKYAIHLIPKWRLPQTIWVE